MNLASRLHRKTLSGSKIKPLVIFQNMASTLGEKETKHAEHFHKTMEVASLETFQKILNSTEIDLSDFVDDMAYYGFDKTKIAKMASVKLGGFLTVKFCLLGAMRGTNLKKIIDKSVNVDTDIKNAAQSDPPKIYSRVVDSNTLTVGRLLATFPEVAAHYMLKNNVPAKLTEVSCPPSLQFPAAAGLPMSHTVRMHHLEFSVRFSFLISSDKKFHPVYYLAAFNGQLDPGRLSKALQEVVGSPSASDSKSVDMRTAIGAMMEKYGAERFDLSGYVAANTN